MIGSFLTRGLVMIFGYAFPAYECYKTVEMNKPEIEHLRFWCQYWILVAVLTVFERVGDAFVSWVPMYSEAKLAFFIYLWYPKTKGTTYVYDSFFRPYVAKHETEIDRNLLELRTRAGDIAVLYWQRAASYAQTRVFDILQYVAAQSTPRPRPAQPQQGAVGRQTSSTSNRQQPPAATQPQTKEPPSPTSSTSSSGQNQDEIVAEEQTHPAVPVSPQTTAAIASQKAVGKPPALLNSQKSVGKPPASVTSQKSVPKPPVKEIIIQPSPSEAEAMQIDLPSALVNANPDEVPEESILEETFRVTRARLRKSRAR